MNKDNAKDFLPLVQALADGKTIQFRQQPSFPWTDLVPAELGFIWDSTNYRIKPEPIELELWYHLASGGTCDVKFTDKESDWTSQGFRKIKVKEVL